MESDKIEQLLEKYFDGNTSIAEENELKNYFSSENVEAHLKQYQSLFGFFAEAKQQKPAKAEPISNKGNSRTWIAIAASVVVMLGIGIFSYMDQSEEQSGDLGSYDDPEVAFRETQKALKLLSAHVNTGVESVQYIEEFDEAKDKVFVR